MTADRGIIQLALIAAGAVCALTDHNVAAVVIGVLLLGAWLKDSAS